MKKTFMPVWILLAALCTNLSFAAGDEDLGSASASPSHPISPILPQETPKDPLADSLSALQIVSAVAPNTSEEDAQADSLLLQMLPDEMLLRILSLVPQKDLNTCALTCKRLKKIVWDLPRDIYLSPHTIPEGKFPFPPHLIRTVHIRHFEEEPIVKSLPLESMARLHTLDFIETYLDEEDVTRIIHVLNTNATLKKLCLFDNKLTSQSVCLIAQTLKTNTSLRRLMLSSNNLGLAEAREVAEALKVNKSLITIDLSKNKMGSSGVKTIVEALLETLTSPLKVLSIDENLLFPEEGGALKARLALAHPTIRSFF